MWLTRLANSAGLLSLFLIRHTATGTLLRDNSESWDLSEKPSLNGTTSNFIFETVNSLLQRWPNTRYRNGHTIVPATIPTGTLLYHGTAKPEIPKVPEWLSVDPEHSYLFCGLIPDPPTTETNDKTNSTSENGCWHLTFVTTRPLKLLYFDGTSAAKMKGGPMDAQDLITWGGVREDLLDTERERIDTLCEWGKDFKLDGFIRMEMDFEIMLCNFTTGLDPVTFLDLTNVLPLPREPGKPSRSMVPLRIRALEASSWSNRFPGDQRMQIDFSRLISFYDKYLFPNLHVQRIGQERWDHRLKGINKAELDGLLARLEKVLMEEERQSTVDWKALLHVVTNRYADRLEMLQYLLGNATTSSEVDQEPALRRIHRFVSTMLRPYILHDSVPPENLTRNDHSWASPVFKYCATTHTQYLETSFLAELTTSERLLLNAIQEVSKEICRVLAVIWAEASELSTKPRGSPDDPKLTAQHLDNEGRHYTEESIRNLLVRWKTSVSDIMAWLDWSVWVRCRPECSYEEMCYLPTWPYFFHRDENALSVHEEDWKKPQPMCLRRLEPYDL